MGREVAAWVSRRSFSAGGRKFRVVTMPRFLGALASAPEAWRSRNLPTHERGLSLDLMYWHPKWGGKTPNIYMLDEHDQAFRVHIAAFQAGTFGIFGPGGRLVAKSESLDWRKSIRTTLHVPKDGKKGTYTLRCLGGRGKTPYGKRWWGYPAVVNVIHCDLPKVVYEAASSRGETSTFEARAWYFGVPANASDVVVHWRPKGKERYLQRHFAVAEVGGSWHQTTHTMRPVNRYGGNVYGDFERYTFAIPPAPKDRVFRCERMCEPHRVMVHGGEDRVGQGFVVVGAPPYVATRAESYFVPSPPSDFQKVAP